jgi:hypothetical protein
MAVFIATSKRFCDEAQQIVNLIKDCGVTVHHPYFHFNPKTVDADSDFKSNVTLQHLSEINDSELFYALLPGGYIGCRVTIELTYAYAKGKKIFVSEEPAEFAVRPMVSEICPPDQFVARFKTVSPSPVKQERESALKFKFRH